jgi:cytochrome c oxidase subunit II
VKQRGKVDQHVRRKRLVRSGFLALSMGALAVVLSGCTSKDWESKLRFGWPTGVTKQAERMRVLWTWSSVAALVVGVIVWALIFWACVKYRKRDDRLPRQTKENLIIEAIYTIVPFFIIGGLFYYTVVVENYVDKRTKNPDVTITVTAFKWNWQFGYNGSKYSAPGANADEIVSTVGTSTEIPILVIPRGETIRVVEHSADVIHSFWVPEFLFKRDVIPQPKDNQFEFTATQNGHYVGRCAELCGTYHSQMNFEVRVVDPDKYTQYVAALAKLGPADADRQAKAMVTIGEDKVATTTYPFNTDRTARSATER